MAKKYIVKNCPCFDEHNSQCLNKPMLPLLEMELCQDQDCTNCSIKQVIEKCNKAIKIADLEGLNGVYRQGLAKDILQLFEIEEIE